jgi:hypothetical protein
LRFFAWASQSNWKLLKWLKWFTFPEEFLAFPLQSTLNVWIILQCCIHTSSLNDQFRSQWQYWTYEPSLGEYEVIGEHWFQEPKLIHEARFTFEKHTAKFCLIFRIIRLEWRDFFGDGAGDNIFVWSCLSLIWTLISISKIEYNSLEISIKNLKMIPSTYFCFVFYGISQ